MLTRKSLAFQLRMSIRFSGNEGWEKERRWERGCVDGRKRYISGQDIPLGIELRLFPPHFNRSM